MRRVRVYKYEQRKDPPRKIKRVFDGFGAFHGWGCNFEEIGEGVGQFTAAIVERRNGVVQLFPVELIEFVVPVEGDS